LLIKVNWQKLSKNVSTIVILTIPLVLCLIYDLVLLKYFPEDTFVLIDDWYNHALYFTMFMLGYALAKSPRIWKNIIENRKTWLVLAIISHTLMIIRFNRAWGFDVDYNNASMVTQFFISTIWSVNKVFWLLTLVSFAGAYLNKKHPILTYMNEAVLPWYILHQSLIIIFAMWLAKLELGPIFEPISLMILTFLSCAIGYELIKRFFVTRFIFGLKI
jgi:hypothetical protein